MLFFVDESWQTISGREIGALGGVGIPERRYNDFCREVFAFKRDVLGAKELSDCELKGSSCFAKSAFRHKESNGFSKLLDSADKMFKALDRYGAKVFAIWTSDPEMSLLKNAKTTAVSTPYKQLLFDMRAYIRNEAASRRGSINFDQRHATDDQATACAISNYLFKTRGDWSSRFVQIPNFTVSAVSPGLQAADLMIYLAPHLADPSHRPELVPYVEAMKNRRYVFRSGKRNAKTVRRVG